jgi:GT2 family glycosyltransferase
VELHVIDIILPYYRKDLYRNCIRSIRDNTDPKLFNIILIDDSDGTLGPIRAYNLGLRKSGNDVVLINDDITVCHRWLDNMLSVKADVVLSVYHNEPFYPNISCTLVKRHVIEAVGYLDEKWTLGFGADNDWFIRMERAGFTIDVNRKNRIWHLHRASIKMVANFRAIAEKEQKMFVDKYHGSDNL